MPMAFKESTHHLGNSEYNALVFAAVGLEEI